MKKIFVFTSLMAALITGHAYAQSEVTETQKTEIRELIKQNREKLKLTAGQEPKVRQIDSAYLSALAALRRSSAGRMAKFKQVKSLNSNRDSQMKAVLSDDQFAQYQKSREEMREELKELRKTQKQ